MARRGRNRGPRRPRGRNQPEPEPEPSTWVTTPDELDNNTTSQATSEPEWTPFDPDWDPPMPPFIREDKEPVRLKAFNAVTPWDVAPRYPAPKDASYCHSFNYARSWPSLQGQTNRIKLQREFDRLRRSELPPLHPDATMEQINKLYEAYFNRYEEGLWNIRAKMRFNSPSSKLLIGSPRAFKADSRPSINRHNHFLNFIFSRPELFEEIVGYLNPILGDLTALAATCTRAARIVQQSFDTWDFNSGVFPIDGRDERELGKKATLIVSRLSDEPDSPETPYMADFQNLMTLAKSIKTVPTSFGKIVLDQIPFLNVPLFEMMVNTMPNLKMATITRCLLLDVTKLKPLLDVIKRHPRKIAGGNRQGANKYIALDFFPYFFRGPNSCKRRGSYGVTYHEPTFHTPKAVFCHIMQCWYPALEVGMDLMSDSSAFWSFVRKLPGPDILWTVKARDTFITRQRDLNQRWKPRQAIETQFYDDLMAALSGDECEWDDIPPKMARFLPEGHHDQYYWRRRAECTVCNFTYPLSLFPMRPGVCWGCKMVQYVAEMEDSHLRQWQASAMANLTAGLEPSSATLHDLPSEGSRAWGKATFDVKCADWTWKWFRNYDPATEYCPPPPKTLSANAKSLARWRWHSNSCNIQPFDYRQGGPQFAEPCKDPLGPTCDQDRDFGPESLKSFKQRWRPSAEFDECLVNWLMQDFDGEPPLTSRDDPRLQERLAAIRKSPAHVAFAQTMQWRAQNARDKTFYMNHWALVEDCIWSMGTPGFRAFNLDVPVPHRRREKKEFKHVWSSWYWGSRPYGGTANNHYW
ncbi:hypothetical protein VTK26DRAFT_5098 [Humicola hyalothermophila]